MLCLLITPLDAPSNPKQHLLLVEGFTSFQFFTLFHESLFIFIVLPGRCLSSGSIAQNSFHESHYTKCNFIRRGHSTCLRPITAKNQVKSAAAPPTAREAAVAPATKAKAPPAPRVIAKNVVAASAALKEADIELAADIAHATGVLVSTGLSAATGAQGRRRMARGGVATATVQGAAAAKVASSAEAAAVAVVASAVLPLLVVAT